MPPQRFDPLNLLRQGCGEVSERFKEHAWKACVGETQPWVRIPPSPPSSLLISLFRLFLKKYRFCALLCPPGIDEHDLSFRIPRKSIEGPGFLRVSAGRWRSEYRA